MSHNQIGEIGGLSIGISLGTNTTLRQLDIGYNNITKAVVSICLASLQKNSSHHIEQLTIEEPNLPLELPELKV